MLAFEENTTALVFGEIASNFGSYSIDNPFEKVSLRGACFSIFTKFFNFGYLEYVLGNSSSQDSSLEFVKFGVVVQKVAVCGLLTCREKFITGTCCGGIGVLKF